MIRLPGFVGCMVFWSAAAFGDIILDPLSVSGSFSTIGNAEVATSDGPHFSQLAPASGITGLKISGSADMVYVNVNSGGTLMLDFGGQASGVMTEPVIHATLDYILTPHWSDSLLHGIYFGFDLYANQQTFHSSVQNLLVDTDAQHPVHGSFAFDFSFPDAVGTAVNDFEGRMSVAPGDFGQVGDGISLLIPDQSLDIGVQGASPVPEPHTWEMIVAGGLPLLLLIWRRRTPSQQG